MLTGFSTVISSSSSFSSSLFSSTIIVLLLWGVILNTSLTYLGITVANIITTFDPEKVVIGGGVINGGDIVLETVKEEVAKRCMKVFVDSCSIEKAKLGGQAGVLGAAALAIME